MSLWQSHSTNEARGMSFWSANAHMRCIHSRTNSGVLGVDLSEPNIMVNRPESTMTCSQPIRASARSATLKSPWESVPLMNG